MLKYFLILNKMTRSFQNVYFARTIGTTTMGFIDLIKALTVPGSILKQTEIVAVISRYWEQIMDYISEGKNYKDKFIEVRLSIAGTFDGPDDRFNTNRHRITISINASNLLKNSTAKIKPQFVDSNEMIPEIHEIISWDKDEFDYQIETNTVLEIKGENLKIYNHTEGQGVYLINTSTDTEYMVDQVRINKPTRLVFKVKNMPSGKFGIEVRNTSKDSTSLRIGRHPKLLNFL